MTVDVSGAAGARRDPAAPGANRTGMTEPQRVFGRLAAALVAGIAMYLAFPPLGLWLLTPAALGAVYACLTLGRPSAGLGALTGFVFGLGLFVPLLRWTGEFVGAFPWLALAVVSALYLALFGALVAYTCRGPGGGTAIAGPPGLSALGFGPLGFGPLWFALLWTAVEWLRSSFPFGGFPWGAAAFSQNQGYFLPFARWFGVPGVGFLVALTGAGVVALIIALVRRRPQVSGADTYRRQWQKPVAVAAVWTAVPVVLAGIALGTAPSPTGGDTIRIAAIQGNVPRLGLDFNAQRRAVLDNHVRETIKLGEDVAAGTRPKPDLIVWPENASDISPLDNPDAARLIAGAVDAVGVPIVFGTVLQSADGPSNTVLVWETQGAFAAPEPTGRYDKHIIQPFGEYLPWRSFFSMFSSYAAQAGNFQAGTGPAVVTVPTERGAVVLGVSTCWEVAFDRSPRQAVKDGGQLLFVPTNNATFGQTDMTYQQLAMSQVRAVETDRSVAVAATSGISALIAPDGRVLTSSEIFTPAILEAQLPLRTGQTLAVRLGPWPQRMVVLGALAVFLFTLARRTRFYTLSTRRTSVPDSGESQDVSDGHDSNRGEGGRRGE